MEELFTLKLRAMDVEAYLGILPPGQSVGEDCSLHDSGCWSNPRGPRLELGTLCFGSRDQHPSRGRRLILGYSDKTRIREVFRRISELFE